MRRFLRLIVRLQRYSDRPWYLPLIALLVALDMFVAVIPSDALVISTAMLRPRRWILVAVAGTLGSALGSFALAAVAHAYGEPLVERFFQGALHSPSWQTLSRWIEDYGYWGMVFISVGPLPQQPGVILCALGGMPSAEVLGAVLLGRALKYGVFSWSATHAPRLFRKRGWAKKEMAKLESTRMEERGGDEPKRPGARKERGSRKPR